MNTVTQLFANLPDNGLPARQVAEYTNFAQSQALFHLAAAKSARVAALRAHFSTNALRKVYLSGLQSGIECAVEGLDAVTLDKDFFQQRDPALRAANKSALASSIVIVNNNDVAQARADYAEFFEQCTTTCFVAWDWDNHHWLELSTFLAAHSDIYAPSHHENLYLLSRYNWLIAGPVYCSSVQWTRAFLQAHLPDIVGTERSNAPLGMHLPYTKFSFRMQVVAALSQHYPSIGFSSPSFHVRSAEDRLKEWYSHKTHWIAPVLNDVPIRIFDALMTGGIPIVPASLRLLPPVSEIPREHIVFYAPGDIVAPGELVARACSLFDEGGTQGIMERHRFAQQQHHGAVSVEQMLNYAFEVLGIDPRP